MYMTLTIEHNFFIYNSDIGGMPSEVSASHGCPITWGYRWFLGFEAGTFPPAVARPSIHSRLRFPDGRDGEGGAGGAAGRRQFGQGGEGRSGRDPAAEGESAPASNAPAGQGYWRYLQQLADLVVEPISLADQGQPQD
jgi:hypothetical protein